MQLLKPASWEVLSDLVEFAVRKSYVVDFIATISNFTASSKSGRSQRNLGWLVK